MKLFEFEAKNILKGYGISIPKGDVAKSPDQTGVITEDIGKPVVLKSQVLVSGRGKAGGILFANNVTEARNTAANLIGNTIKGSVVVNLLVEEKLDIADQFYASVTIDRQARSYAVLASTSGGMDIEQTTLDSPDRISRYWVDSSVGFSKHAAESMIAQFSNISKDDATKFASIIYTLYKVAMDYDAELVEINPLAKTYSGEFIAADARMIVDDNALFRHPEFENRDSLTADDTPWEAEARRQKLAYVDLPGDIGVIGNGAGLVMATVDLVYLLGGKPASFLDIGGGARAEVIKRAVAVVMSKPQVRAVLINILGGITRCDIVAQGIVDALSDSTTKRPVVVRMIGTNEEEGVKILRQAGVHAYPNMEDAIAAVLRICPS
jgi:succinyl-CoA synthetase beta subunit